MAFDYDSYLTFLMVIVLLIAAMLIVTLLMLPPILLTRRQRLQERMHGFEVNQIAGASPVTQRKDNDHG